MRTYAGTPRDTRNVTPRRGFWDFVLEELGTVGAMAAVTVDFVFNPSWGLFWMVLIVIVTGLAILHWWPAGRD